ncbi:hypothetical protein RRG08_053840 [Elysia crispata]|uniref:Plethodontid modulating factor n=1 Tax=Elysia crispata TaxID=231223 RepID=A0AAE1AB71_9GAST|nr:hypothetical protein RRG08_053840 [Elysia crispata]
MKAVLVLCLTMALLFVAVNADYGCLSGQTTCKDRPEQRIDHKSLLRCCSGDVHHLVLYDNNDCVCVE